VEAAQNKARAKNEPSRKSAENNDDTNQQQSVEEPFRFLLNESVPIQLAQCWFPGAAISGAKI